MQKEEATKTAVLVAAIKHVIREQKADIGTALLATTTVQAEYAYRVGRAGAVISSAVDGFLAGVEASRG